MEVAELLLQLILLRIACVTLGRCCCCGCCQADRLGQSLIALQPLAGRTGCPCRVVSFAAIDQNNRLQRRRHWTSQQRAYSAIHMPRNFPTKEALLSSKTAPFGTAQPSQRPRQSMCQISRGAAASPHQLSRCTWCCCRVVHQARSPLLLLLLNLLRCSISREPAAPKLHPAVLLAASLLLQ